MMRSPAHGPTTRTNAAFWYRAQYGALALVFAAALVLAVSRLVLLASE